MNNLDMSILNLFSKQIIVNINFKRNINWSSQEFTTSVLSVSEKNYAKTERIFTKSETVINSSICPYAVVLIQ
jgi:hypothetical protein